MVNKPGMTVIYLTSYDGIASSTWIVFLKGKTQFLLIELSRYDSRHKTEE